MFVAGGEQQAAHKKKVPGQEGPGGGKQRQPGKSSRKNSLAKRIESKEPAAEGGNKKQSVQSSQHNTPARRDIAGSVPAPKSPLLCKERQSEG